MLVRTVLAMAALRGLTRMDGRRTVAVRTGPATLVRLTTHPDHHAMGRPTGLATTVFPREMTGRQD